LGQYGWAFALDKITSDGEDIRLPEPISEGKYASIQGNPTKERLSTETRLCINSL
jgi:hypothetical protein